MFYNYCILLSDTTATTSSSMTSGRVLAVLHLLSKPLSDACLHQELKKMNFRHAIEICTFLWELLSDRPLGPDSQVGTSETLALPSIFSAVAWLSAIYKGHYSSLKLEQVVMKNSVFTEQKMDLLQKLVSLDQLQSCEISINNHKSTCIILMLPILNSCIIFTY